MVFVSTFRFHCQGHSRPFGQRHNLSASGGIQNLSCTTLHASFAAQTCKPLSPWIYQISFTSQTFIFNFFIVLQSKTRFRNIVKNVRTPVEYLKTIPFGLLLISTYLPLANDANKEMLKSVTSMAPNSSEPRSNHTPFEMVLVALSMLLLLRGALIIRCCFILIFINFLCILTKPLLPTDTWLFLLPSTCNSVPLECKSFLWLWELMSMQITEEMTQYLYKKSTFFLFCSQWKQPSLCFVEICFKSWTTP